MHKPIDEKKRLDEFEDSSLPLHGIAVNYSKGHIIESHFHNNNAQLLYAISGILLVKTRVGRWLVPPNRAVWIIPQEEHTVVIRSNAKIRSLFIKADSINTNMPNNNCVINVSSLLKELILASTSLPINYEADKYASLLVNLLLEELKRHATSNLLLPWPNDARYQNICKYLIHYPTDSRSIQQWANELNISAKTFQRQFLQLTNIPFGKWRQQARLLYSLEALGEGQPITNIALNFGYSSHSAYSAAFKNFFGKQPSDFIESCI